MAIDGIYFKENRITTDTAIQGKDPSKLDMNDFFNLLTAQLTNQDMMNPVNDTEFIAQMAQFSALQGVQTIQEYQLSAYAASYAGKYVTIASQTELGKLETVSGKVDAVNFYDGSPKVLVNGKTYDLHTVMEVSDTATGSSLSEAAQYIGKTVTISYKDDFGAAKEFSGKVTGVTIKNNVPQVIIGDKEYPVSAVKSVNEQETQETEDE